MTGGLKCFRRCPIYIILVIYTLIVFMDHVSGSEMCPNFYLGEKHWYSKCPSYCCGTDTYRYCCNVCARSINSDGSFWCSSGTSLSIIIGCVFFIFLLVCLIVSCCICNGCAAIPACQRRLQQVTRRYRTRRTSVISPSTISTGQLSSIASRRRNPNINDSQSVPKPFFLPPTYEECGGSTQPPGIDEPFQMTPTPNHVSANIEPPPSFDIATGRHLSETIPNIDQDQMHSVPNELPPPYLIHQSNQDAEIRISNQITNT